MTSDLNIVKGLVLHHLFENKRGRYLIDFLADRGDWRENVERLLRIGSFVEYSFADKTIILEAVLLNTFEYANRSYASAAEQELFAESRSRAQKRWSRFKKLRYMPQLLESLEKKCSPQVSERRVVIEAAASAVKILLIENGRRDWGEMTSLALEQLNSPNGYSSP